MLAGAEAEAKKNQWNMVIAVLDSGGHLVMLSRMDGTQLGSIDAAKDKAYCSGCFEGNECTPAIEEDPAESQNTECD